MNGKVCVKTPAGTLEQGLRGWPVLMAKDTTDSKQMGKHCRMCVLHEDQEVCAVIRPQHRWLITRRPVP